MCLTVLGFANRVVFAYSPFKNARFIAAQILAVCAFVVTLLWSYIGPDICAGIAMIVLAVGACRNMKPVRRLGGRYASNKRANANSLSPLVNNTWRAIPLAALVNGSIVYTDERILTV